ncbi:MAG: TonB-dependent receptor [Bacteroidetes bacterium]|nr:TonB-dependent receptor [Bacteroidota bacterium]
MMKYVYSTLLTINCIVMSILGSLELCYAQGTDTLTTQVPPVVVTALRYPIDRISSTYPVDVANVHHYTETMGARSIEDVLTYGTMVHVQPRGVHGVQSDLSIRGSLFSQQLVLVNGVRGNDPQTGHHTMNIPISLDQVDRIEVVKGPLSVLYGADAYGGVINIVPRIPIEDIATVRLHRGQYSFWNVSAFYSTATTHGGSSIALDHRQSGGYRRGTEFQVTSLSSISNYETPLGVTTVILGTVAKNFGAENFYGPAPSKERTHTTIAQVGLSSHSSRIHWKQNISYRRHDDRFQYNRHILDRFINTHTSHLLTVDVQGDVELGDSASLTAGCEGILDRITSSNLGNHMRRSLGVFGVLSFPLVGSFHVTSGIRIDFHSAYATQLSPNVSARYSITPLLRLYSSVGTSFRAPSYTELYYTSPSRQGNSSLQPERGLSFECGIIYVNPNGGQGTLSLFERRQSNLIDYVKFSPTDIVYRATNFTRARTRGIEAQYIWRNSARIGIHSYQLGYMYLDSRIDRGTAVASLYTLIHPRHHLNAIVSSVLPFGIEASACGSYRIRTNAPSVVLLNCNLRMTVSQFVVSIQGTNLLNTVYEDIPGVQLPGRWLIAGIEATLL